MSRQDWERRYEPCADGLFCFQTFWSMNDVKHDTRSRRGGRGAKKEEAERVIEQCDTVERGA